MRLNGDAPMVSLVQPAGFADFWMTAKAKQSSVVAPGFYLAELL